VALADDASGVIEQLDRALATDTHELALERSARALANNWESRLEEIASLLAGSKAATSEPAIAR
jgi:hypothetical protein